MSPTAEGTTPTRTAAQGGSISTVEIKARIEAMFTYDDEPAAASESGRTSA